MVLLCPLLFCRTVLWSNLHTFMTEEVLVNLLGSWHTTLYPQLAFHVFHCSFVCLMNRMSSVHDSIVSNKVTYGVDNQGCYQWGNFWLPHLESFWPISIVPSPHKPQHGFCVCMQDCWKSYSGSSNTNCKKQRYSQLCVTLGRVNWNGSHSNKS